MAMNSLTRSVPTPTEGSASMSAGSSMLPLSAQPMILIGKESGGCSCGGGCKCGCQSGGSCACGGACRH